MEATLFLITRLKIKDAFMRRAKESVPNIKQRKRKTRGKGRVG